MSEPAVLIDGASLGYSGKEVLAGLSLAVAAGEFVGLVGPNGAGKTTCLRAVAGLPVVLEGEVSVLGAPIGSYGAKDRARALAVLPQSIEASFSFSAEEFVAFGRHARMPRLGQPSASDMQVVRDVMERTDTAHLAREQVTALSGGDLQRLALAQALAQEPKVLLLDEPTSHLDVNHALQILDLVRGLVDEGMAVLAVFHDLGMAARYSDRVAVLGSGRLVADGSPKDVLEPRTIREVFGVRAVVGTDPATGAVTVTPLLREDDVGEARETRVLVIGGSGSAAFLLRRMVGAGYRVRMGAISAGDTDDAVANVLDVERVRLEPFGMMDDASEAAVGRFARDSDVVVVAATPFGSANLGNLRAVVGSGARILFVGGFEESRDFAKGEATALWERAIEAGAVEVVDDEAALAALGEVDRG